MCDYQIAASILSADFARLGQEVQAVLEAGADLIHFDVMDNHYVPNLTVGPLVCQSLRNYGIQAPIDVHLMTKPVDSLIEQFAQAGASMISIHPESTEHLDRSLQLIENHGCEAGLALNPATAIDWLHYVSHRLSFLLMMTVNPGFPGQAFIPEMLQKIRDVKTFVDERRLPITIAVDGGIKADTIAQTAAVGAERFIVGTGIFKHSDYQQAIQNLRQTRLHR